MSLEVAARGQNDVLLDKSKVWDQIKNENDPFVNELGRFAVMEHVHKLVGIEMTFVRVVSYGSFKVPGGKNYCLLVEVKERPVVAGNPSPTNELYVADVFVDEIDKSWKLVAFIPVSLRVLGHGPVIPNA